MAAIHDLLAQVQDEALRARLEQEINRLSKTKKFGLVFEEHLPECTLLYDISVKRGSTVAKKTGAVSEMYEVSTIKDGVATCYHKVTEEKEEIPVEELVSVAQFGEPIYPYLKPIDSVCNAPDSDLWHTLIEADNYHALQLLEYLYAGKVDCIYIDPPYNTGARDWKYNNNYVDSADAYRHSKWLSFMQKRLRIAKSLLCEDGVLIVAIDDYEVARLIQLIEEIMPNHDVSPVIVNHHPQGGAADNISRTHEYALFVTPKGLKLIKGNKTEDVEERWSLTRGGTDVRNLRKGRPNSFYAIYVDKETREVKGVGPHLDADTPYERNEAPEGCLAFYPAGKDGKERVWRYERESMMQHITDGDIICTEKMTLNVVKKRDVKYDPVFSVWTDGRYNAGTFGTSMLQDIFSGETRFSYPKSLYTVVDCIKYSTQEKPDALVIDFFAGSGTTAHAVNLLNEEDGGHRRCILVTNNEVSEEEAKALSRNGINPGDPEWEENGVARHITWPRTVCTIKGTNTNGEPLGGNYLGLEQPMSKGFRANAAYFKLGFLDKTSIALGRQLSELFPVLWLKAGAHGVCPQLLDNNASMIVLPENKFAILVDEKCYQDFEEAVDAYPDIQTIYIVTDSEAGYREMIVGYGDKDTYQLYRDYLDNFRINTGR